MQGSSDGARLEEIEAFAAVAEGGGFAIAAKRMGRDASVLSRRVGALEGRLGVRLLARTTRRVTLTEAGAAYLRRVQAVLAELAAADAEAADRAAVPRGVLRLALPAAFGRMWVAPLLPGFLAAYPAISIEMAHADRYVDLVADGFDVAVRVGALPDSSLVTRRLAPFRRLLCASPSYLAAHGTPEAPEALVRHACLGFVNDRIGPEWLLHQGSRQITVRTDGPLVANDGEALATAAIGGAGVMQAADWLVGRELADGRLVEVLPKWSVGGDGAVHAVLPAGRLVPAKTRALVEWVAAAFAPKPPWHAVPILCC